MKPYTRLTATLLCFFGLQMHRALGAEFWMHLLGISNSETVVAASNTYVWLPIEANQPGWTNLSVGYGSGLAPESYTWTPSYFYANGDNSDKKTAAPVLFKSNGTFFIVGRGRLTTNDAWSYANTTNWAFDTNFLPTCTITVVGPTVSVDTSLVASIEMYPRLSWETTDSNAIYDILWASSLTSGWRNSWSTQLGIQGGPGQLSTDLPQFFRVRKRTPAILLETVYVPSSGITIHFTNAFARGTYTLTHDGVYRYDFIGSSQKFTDGEYLQADDLLWYQSGDGLTLHVNEADLSPTRPDVISHHHEYDFVVIGTDPLLMNASIYDPLNYTDNDGGLYVGIRTR